MCKKVLPLLILTGFILISVNSLKAQTLFWSDNFETGVSPSSGTRAPEENGGVGGPPNTSYFRLTDGSTVSQVVPFTGKEGSFYWAGEDHNAAGTGFTASGAQGAATNSALNELTLTWTGINISGKTGLSFKGLFAANSTNEPWDNINACLSGVGTTNTDYIIVQYSIDGGGFVDLIRFFNKGSATNGIHKYMFEDTDGNGCGDGTQLTNAFGEFTKSIPGTGTTLSIRLLVYCEGASEEWGVDNFRLLQTTGLPLTWASFTARKQDNSILLNWSTSSEQDTKDFTVQHRDETHAWTNLSVLPAAGNSHSLLHYRYVHTSPANGTNFYRILQADLDGKSSFSEIKAVKFTSTHPVFTLLTNPVVNGVLQVQVNQPVNLSLLSVEGKLTWKKQATAGLVSIPVGAYLKGIYWLRGKNEFRKIIIQ